MHFVQQLHKTTNNQVEEDAAIMSFMTQEKVVAFIKMRKKQVLFWGILALAFLLRCIRFAAVPDGINQDEAMGAMDAWALSQYGTDRFGTFLPVHFAAWQTSQMSVLLSYCMIPLIKIFGFSTVTVRLPMLLISTGAAALVYLVGQKLFGERIALVAMLLTAVNPWQFMQSRWSLDCNLFPHVFLLAFYLLLLGLEKRRYLYLAMPVFGLTFYCYGIAAYSVTAFLFVFFVWCLWKRQIRFREGVLCAVLFTIVALPEIIVLGINAIHFGQTIETPLFTMPYFPYSVRSADILLLNFSFTQLGRNAWALFSHVFLQLPDIFFNSIPAFGPLYHVSIPFVFAGIVIYTAKLFGEKDTAKQTKMLALWGFLITGIWVGLITYEVNINRVNIIFYPLLLLCAYGVDLAIQKWRKLLPVIVVAYGISSVLFFVTYFTSYAQESGKYYNRDFLNAIVEADNMEAYYSLYITGNLGWQFNQSATEILTQYACRIDALYYQGKSNFSNGRVLPDYADRYHYIYPEKQGEELAKLVGDGLLVLHKDDLEYITFGYQEIDTVGDYVLVTVQN